MRVASLAPALTETLVALGARDELVGVSVYCRSYAPGKPIVGTYISVVWRRLEEARPDLVLLQGPAQQGLQRILAGRGYRAVLLPLPTSLHGVAENVAAVGGLVGRRVEGLELALRLEERIAVLEASKPPAARAYAEIVFPDYRARLSPGALSFTDHALRLAGLANIYSNEPRPYVEPSPARVTGEDPEYIVVSGEELMGLTAEKYLKHTPWAAGLKAVMEGRLILLPGGPGKDLAHPGPSILDTVEALRLERLRRSRMRS